MNYKIPNVPASNTSVTPFISHLILMSPSCELLWHMSEHFTAIGRWYSQCLRVTTFHWDSHYCHHRSRSGGPNLITAPCYGRLQKSEKKSPINSNIGILSANKHTKQEVHTERIDKDTPRESPNVKSKKRKYACSVCNLNILLSRTPFSTRKSTYVNFMFIEMPLIDYA